MPRVTQPRHLILFRLSIGLRPMCLTHPPLAHRLQRKLAGMPITWVGRSPGRGTPCGQLLDPQGRLPGLQCRHAPRAAYKMAEPSAARSHKEICTKIGNNREVRLRLPCTPHGTGDIVSKYCTVGKDYSSMTTEAGPLYTPPWESRSLIRRIGAWASKYYPTGNHAKMQHATTTAP